MLSKKPVYSSPSGEQVGRSGNKIEQGRIQGTLDTDSRAVAVMRNRLRFKNVTHKWMNDGQMEGWTNTARCSETSARLNKSITERKKE